MAFVTTTTRPASAPLVERLFQTVRAFRIQMERRAVYNQTVRELQALTTRELDDLGMSREMITRIANEAAYGK